MRKQIYQGCNCFQCSYGGTRAARHLKRTWKRKSHQKYRRLERWCIRQGIEPPECIAQPFWRA